MTVQRHTQTVVRTSPLSNVRWMVEGDMDSALSIELQCFPEPWTDEEFRDAMRHPDCMALVGEIGARVVGYVVYQRGRKTIELLNLAVHPRFSRRGVGAALVARVVFAAEARHLGRVRAIVRERNLPAQLLFRACGFRCTKTWREWYGRDEAGYRFEREVAQ